MLPVMFTTTSVSTSAANKQQQQQANKKKPSLKKQVKSNPKMTSAADHVLNKAKEKVNKKMKDLENDPDYINNDSDALTTMNAIMEYNKKLIEKLNQLEQDNPKITSQDIQDTINETLYEIKSIYDDNVSLDNLEPSEQEESVQEDTNAGTFSLGNNERDDIIVKVEARKDGISFSLHIPRN